MKKATRAATPAPTTEQLVKMRLFLGDEAKSLAREMKIPVTTVRQHLDELVAIGTGTKSGDHLRVPAIITTSVATEISCLSPRRLRTLLQEGRIKGRKIGKAYAVQTESLRSFLQKPRAVGTAGQKLLRGKSWVNPKEKHREKERQAK